MLTPGSRIRVGFVFDWSPDLGYDPSTNEAQLVSIIRANLLNFLDDGVTFSNVSVVVDPLPGWFSSGYITVEATTNTQLPNAETFGDMAAYAIAQYLLIINITRRDATRIDYAAPAPTPRPSTPTPSPNIRPRPGEPTPDSSGYFVVGAELPDVTGTPGPYTPPPLPTEQKKGINTTWLLLGFGLLAVVMISRD
jgi:hypothetical protein